MASENINLQDDIEYFKYSFEQAQNLVEFADSKANILLAIHTLVFSIYSAAIILNLNKIGATNWQYILGIIFGVLFILSISTSIVLTGKVIIPRDAKDNDSLFYYKTIASYKSSKKYFDHFKNLKDNEIAKGLAHQSYNVSLIADKKMKLIRWSVRVMFVYLAFLLISSIFLIIGTNQ